MKQILFALALTLSIPMVSFATSRWDNTNPPKNDAPLDGGLSILLVAGAGYGVKRYAQAKKKNTIEQ